MGRGFTSSCANQMVLVVLSARLPSCRCAARRALLGTCLALALIGAGCGQQVATRPGGARGRATPGPGVGDAPVEVVRRDGQRVARHACGESIIPEHPRRVVAFALADPMFFLGLKPVAQAGLWDWRTEDNYLNPYLNGVGHVGGVYGGRMPDVESAWNFRPDLILLNTISVDTYQRMRRLAPTVVLDARTDVSSNDRQRTIDVGILCNVEQRARRAVAWYDRKVALARAALAQQIPGQRVGVMWFFVKQLRLYNCDVLYKDLALRPPRLLSLDPRTFLGVTVLNLEQLGDCDIDHMFLIWADQPQRNLNLDNVRRLPLWDRIPAVRRNSVHHVAASSWAGGGILADSIVVSQVIEALIPAEQRSAELRRHLKDRPTDDDLRADAAGGGS